MQEGGQGALFSLLLLFFETTDKLSSEQDLYVWTVNSRREMIEATKWGARAILTDRTDALLALRAEMAQDYDKVAKETSWKFGWTSLWYTSLANVRYPAFLVSLFLPSSVIECLILGMLERRAAAFSSSIGDAAE
jgi:hypothetical protein